MSSALYLNESNPAISILIPVFNRRDLIQETLDSIIAQTFHDWECIVVDDGSNDGTRELLEHYSQSDPRIKWLARPENVPQGPNGCRNFAFSQSKGEYVKFFDSDDLLRTDAFECNAQRFAQKPDVIVSALQFFSEDGVRLDRAHRYKSQNPIKDYLGGKIDWYVLQTWKRSFLARQPELFDTTLRNLDDWDFNLRMLYGKPKVVYIDEALSFYRVHGSSLSHEVGKLNRREIESEFMAREKHVSLLKQNKLADVKILQDYISHRWAYILRQSLSEKNSDSRRFLGHLLKAQLRSRKFASMLRTAIGYAIFTLFGKGYKLLKP